MSKRADILCLGEPMVEFVRQTDSDAPLYLRGLGGDSSNAAIAAARQGASVGLLTALGSDPFGEAALDVWRREGVDISAIHRDGTAPTGIYFVDPDPAGRAFTYYRSDSAASRMTPERLDHDAIDAAKVLHLSGITLAVSPALRATAFAAMARAKAAGAAVSLDTNLRLKLWPIEEARAVIHDAMAHASIAVTSIDDSAELTGLSDPAAIAEHYAGRGPDIVLVTMGAEGCHLLAGGAHHHIPAAAAEPVDSTGAGDSFAGAFLAWWLELGDAVEAAQRAAIVAAGTVSGLGAVAPIPRRAEVLEKLSIARR